MRRRRLSPQELRQRAQRLGQVLLSELKILVHSLEKPSIVLDASSLSTFSPPSSSQAQLLRLLKTIEYLQLDPAPRAASSEGLNPDETQDGTVIGEIYETLGLSQMWQQLGRCLTAMEARGDTDQVAMVLLPLVEALMVVSKYGHHPAITSRSPSLPPTAANEAEDLFVSFTTAHRKVLNDIVRNNPTLLSGSFALLIRNPESPGFR